MSEETNRDEVYLRAMKFAENMQERHPGISNLYVFQSIDKDGNIVDEKYGMNLMTNLGFQNIYGSNSPTTFDGSALNLYVGTGRTVVQRTDTTFTRDGIDYTAFGGLAATETNNTKSYNYPIYYSPNTTTPGYSIITLISKFMEAQYPADISGYAGMTFDLGEYGLGTSSTNLYTHSLIYDMNGTATVVRKHPGVILKIFVYMCLSFYEEVITSGWSHNRFVAITSNAIMYDRMGWNTDVYTYKRGNVFCNRSASHACTMSRLTDNEYKLNIPGPEFTLADGTGAASGYFDGFLLWKADSLAIFEPQFLSEPENVEYTNFWSNDPNVYSGFADKFGNYPSSDYNRLQWPQLTHLTNAKAYLYDWKQSSWACEMDIYNPDAKWYTETPAESGSALPVYYWNNDRMNTGYLYQNIRPDDRILSITSGAIEVYATNKYWASALSGSENTDPDQGWVWIRDYSTIPAACQTAKYWITNTKSDSLKFVRESDCFKLLEKGTQNTGYATYPSAVYPIVNGMFNQCDNYDYGWFKTDNTVYVPSRLQKFTNIGPSSNETMTFGRWMVIFGSSNNTITVVDMNDVTSTGIVTPVSVTLNFTSNVNALTGTYRTQSSTGYICIQSISTEEAIVLDLTGSSITQRLYNWKSSCCIWGTDKAAYINAGTGDEYVYIRNLVNDSQDGGGIPFPSSGANIPMLFGHTNYVWMAGPSLGSVVDLTTRNVEAASVSSLYVAANFAKTKFSCVDDVFLVYRYDDGKTNPIGHYILLSTPTASVAMTDFNRDNSSDKGTYQLLELRYINRYSDSQSRPHAALVLIHSRSYTNSGSQPNGADNVLYDFGQYLRMDPSSRSVTGIRQTTHSKSSNVSCYMLYGESVVFRARTKIPMMNLMPIKLIGKTDTITATNNLKHVSNKSWMVSFSNSPLWTGKPPGRPTAVTDGTGEIRNWT